MSPDPVDQAVEVLNRIHQADPSVLPTLIAHRVPCNQQLADDPTVQVGDRPGSDQQAEVGLLGIINGLFGADPTTNVGHISAIYNDRHQLVCFARTLRKSP